MIDLFQMAELFQIAELLFKRVNEIGEIDHNGLHIVNLANERVGPDFRYRLYFSSGHCAEITKQSVSKDVITYWGTFPGFKKLTIDNCLKRLNKKL
jgi:hypothetical protein